MKRSILNTLKTSFWGIKIAYLKSLLFIFFILLSPKAASPVTDFVSIPVTAGIDVYDKLVKAVVQVESKGDTLAFNLKEGAVGAFQIRRVRLLDYNKETGKNYTMQDCYSYNISREIFLHYAAKIGYPDYEKIARKWNGSGKMTLDYWKKVKVLL